jgi:cell wall-associated NlpC family hydrolase
MSGLGNCLAENDENDDEDKGVAVTLRTRLVSRVTGVRRGIAVAAAVLVAGGLATGITQIAGAQPRPTISQVQAKVNQLTAKFDKAVQQYDQVAQQLKTAKARLGTVNGEMARDQAKYNQARKRVVGIASAAYQDSGQTSLAGLLTANNPEAVLNAASMLLQLAGARNQETRGFLGAAQQLSSVQQQQQRTEYAVNQLAKKRANTRNSIKKLLDTQKATLDSLTAQQQQTVQNNSLGSGGTTSGTYTGPTGTQSDTAVQFVYNQLGCPYLYGGTGPCHTGFDCSGLMQAAWAAAGVSIPRDTYEQWAALPHISESSIQPGDLLYYDGEGHVTMYVGGGYMIDAPHTGAVVEKVPMNESWYTDSFDGAVRP